MTITRNTAIVTAIFKKEGNEFKAVDSLTIGEIHWKIQYYRETIIYVSYWTKKGKERIYGMESVPKVIKAWLVIQGINLDYRIEHRTPF